MDVDFREKKLSAERGRIKGCQQRSCGRGKRSWLRPKVAHQSFMFLNQHPVDISAT